MSMVELLKKDLLNDIARVRPDELAPSLGAVILAIAEGKTEGEFPYYKPSVFFNLTYPSDNFISVLRSVVETLERKAVASIFLNLDMGSGKTHLLTLLLHLFASYKMAPQQLSGYIDDYKSKTGYSEKLASKVVVFAFDLRTPKLASRYLKLTEILLKSLENHEAAEIVKKAYEEGRLPDAKTLAENIDKNLNILILIDELHYAAVLGDEKDRDVVKEVVKFVLDLVNYRRALRAMTSGIAVVVASARRDFNRWCETKYSLDPLFVNLIESFIDQMQRIESTAHTRWLGLDEAKRILEKRLDLQSGNFDKIFHKSFEKFIERVVKADTDVPQAHHLRSLIKAIAIYALEAYESNDDMVTPAHFTEEVIDVLLPGDDLAVGYKSIHGRIDDFLKKSVRYEETLKAINSIFSLTVTGAPEKLVEMVRVAKTRTPPKDIPLITEAELREVLKAHKLSDSDINEIIEKLDTIHPNIHRVSLASGDYAYFVVPIPSVLAIYRRMILDKQKALMSNPAELAKRVCDYLLNFTHSENALELKAIESFQELEKVPHSPNKFYTYIYVNKALLTQLLGEQTREDSFNTMRTEAMKFLEERGKLNIAIVLPRITREVLEGVARFIATDESTADVINEYVAPLEKPRRSLEEIAQKLIEIELGDLKAEMGRRLNDALAVFTSSMKNVFAEALYHTPIGVMSEYINLDLKKREIKVNEIQKIIDDFRKSSNNIIESGSKLLAERMKSGHIIFASSALALNTVYQSIAEELNRRQFASFRIDEERVEKLENNKWLYISPRIMESIANSIIQRAKENFKDKYDVNVKQEENKYVITLIPIKSTEESHSSTDLFTSSPSPTPITIGPKPTPPQPPQPSQWENLVNLIDSVVKKGGGTIWVKIEIKDEECADRIINHLSRIMSYIKGSKEEAS